MNSADTVVAQLDDATAGDEDVRGQKVRSASMVVGLAILITFIAIAILAPLIATHDPSSSDILNKLESPSREHLLGTDALGRDVFSRLIFAARLDLAVAFGAATTAAIIGTVLGSLAGFGGRLADTLVMRLADVIQAFPVYVLLIALLFAIGEGLTSLLVAFALVAWVPYARLLRGEILRIRDLDYINAATLGGLSRTRVLIGHILPNTLKQPVIYYALDVVGAVVALSAVAFLGLGIPPDTIEWGLMIADGQLYLRDQWWLAVVPGLVIAVLGLGLTLVADALDTQWRER